MDSESECRKGFVRVSSSKKGFVLLSSTRNSPGARLFKIPDKKEQRHR